LYEFATAHFRSGPALLRLTARTFSLVGDTITPAMDLSDFPVVLFSSSLSDPIWASRLGLNLANSKRAQVMIDERDGQLIPRLYEISTEHWFIEVFHRLQA